jgi:hypothetical protein
MFQAQRIVLSAAKVSFKFVKKAAPAYLVKSADFMMTITLSPGSAFHARLENIWMKKGRLPVKNAGAANFLR